MTNESIIKEVLSDLYYTRIDVDMNVVKQFIIEALNIQRKKFIKDLTYIDTVTVPSSSPSNVFIRIQKIKDKWESTMEKK